jgi:SAM-dependent methyltransferase
MLAGTGLNALGPTTWADLGCGEGTFTLALAGLLADGSTIHAIDRNRSALDGIPASHRGVRITTHVGDFTKQPWPFDALNGILMANSLHYLHAPAAFIAQCELRMKPPRRFLIVEYDTEKPNRWVPYPVSMATAETLFRQAGYASIRLLSSQPSVYQRAALYAVLIEP